MGGFAWQREEAPHLHPQCMDVCAFVGVAPRGPAYQPGPDDAALPGRRSVPVLVHSFDEYRSLFGGYEGPGYLPYAVALFFEQGGRSAYIVRIVHEYEAPAPSDSATLAAPWREAWARGSLAGLATRPLELIARNEGAWGNGLQAAAGCTVSALDCRWRDGALRVARAGAAGIGTLLRLAGADGRQALAFCRGARRQQGGAELDLEPAPPFDPVRVEVVEAWLEVHDGAGRHERYDGLGWSPGHPRWMAAVLCEESQLLWPGPGWARQPLRPAGTDIAAVAQLRGSAPVFSGGRDRYGDVQHEDFFDPLWTGGGMAALAACPDITYVVAPDLYVPAQWADDHCTAQGTGGTPPAALRQLILDPRHFADLNAIAALQQQMLDLCERSGSMIALLDVPPGVSQAQAMRWRAQFGSSWGAAYHPWLVASRESVCRTAGAQLQGGAPRPLPPSAVAAGIIARREIARGEQGGPVHETARAIARLGEPQPADRAGLFEPLGLNCFVRGSDGVQLVSQLTLSRDRAWGQLPVRRLMLMLERTLMRETRWVDDEPDSSALWHELQRSVDDLLQRLFQAGAWAGATQEASYFVRLNHGGALHGSGGWSLEIGVAPAEPLEFIMMCLYRNGDGALELTC